MFTKLGTHLVKTFGGYKDRELKLNYRNENIEIYLGYRPHGIALDKKTNNLFIGTEKEISVYGLDGKYRTTYQPDYKMSFCFVGGLWFDDNLRRLFVCDSFNRRIQILDEHGHYITHFLVKAKGNKKKLNEQFPGLPDYITVLEGRTYVTDGEYDLVQVTTVKRNFLFQFGENGTKEGEFSKPRGIYASAPSEQIYVCDNKNHRVQVFSLEGDFLFAFGSGGTEAGKIKYPTGICGYEGNIFVSEEGNKRVSVFSEEGKFLECFGDGETLQEPAGIVVHDQSIFVVDAAGCVCVYKMS